MKRTPLKRGAPLRRLSRLAARSARTIEESEAHAAIRARVFTRDGYRCQVWVLGRGRFATPRCRGPLTPHHRRKASQGGSYTMENLVTACAGCNEALEADADLARWARSVGLVVRRGDEGWGALGATRR